LKARDADPERSLAVCRSLGAEARGILVQRDTCFRSGRGRLKLREEEDGAAHARVELISYQRPDRDSARESRYRIVAVERAEELEAALRDALGIEAVVVKERRLFLWRGVRIHLDRVEGLGDCIELEAVLGADLDLAAGRERIESLREELEIEDADLVASSYSDLLAGVAASKNSIGPERST
jgi:adenylate cyclase, class 2